MPDPEPGFCQWSGDYPVPAIGDYVTVRLNRYGPGMVTSYFVEHGWLGLHVALSDPIKVPAHRAGCRDAMVFGCDLHRSAVPA